MVAYLDHSNLTQHHHFPASLGYSIQYRVGVGLKNLRKLLRVRKITLVRTGYRRWVASPA